ncbi:hypothetical protein E4U41_007351 [Claviceps citrina]|nr:hypothetical protein E4U41_007351 [Claviceps citrina]
MVGSKRNASTRSSRRTAAAKSTPEPGIYQQMLAEAGVSATEQGAPERPLKRRRPDPEQQVGRQVPTSSGQEHARPDPRGSDGDSDEDIEFEDVVLPTATVQTMELDPDDDDDDDDGDGDGDDDDAEDEAEGEVDFTAPLTIPGAPAEQTNHLELNLTAQKAAATSSVKRHGERRKPLSKEERARRVDVHRAHLVCLLSHVARRNHWCNDERAQDSLRPHLSDRTVGYLTPSRGLPQFGRSESLKKGLKESVEMWRTKFVVTERGIRRALWAEDVAQLRDYEPPSDMDSCLDRAEFHRASKRLQGSRDVGAQLYCALLRSTGVRARLVCSLQPLAWASGAPTLARKPSSTDSGPRRTTPRARAQDALARYEALAATSSASSASPSTSTARRRLGHPNATAYDFQPPRTAAAAPASPRRTTHEGGPVRIRESAHPVYWVEVLDEAHQNWQPVDPVVTHSFWKPKVLEPPMTDRENSLSYVVAFEADGTAKDVTRRYAKAYTAKTRKLRVEAALHDNGEWWRRALRPLRRRRATDLDQIEDNQLAGVEAREPMPKNVQDFKDHPVYALERHLRRHEVLAPDARPSGTLTVGSRGPLEKVYRRTDVRIARSADKWYRMGRQVRPNEIPAKWLPRRAPRPGNGRHDDDRPATRDNDDALAAGVPIYTTEQTEPYEPPPVRNGRVPKNKFGNIDAYVPSMIPKGGVHIVHEHAARAAFTLGVDYAPALTGFSFKGRHGTAVLSGIVAAQEFQEAIWAVVEGLADEELEAGLERRRRAACGMWRRLLMGLRIRERVWSGVGEEERREAEMEAEREAGREAGRAGGAEGEADTDEFDVVVGEDGGGWFSG